eukprot:TRINITY_DN28071_c0_g1_i1.p1 TRINITY_DN28071_c0_g1~~TRINITY_DN28071_c0_g1_i1.p1  ORF type:complete len:215 (-),score=70.84 TRINITY_DN28071_c0_g1_i1:16-660(-)
MIEELNDKVTCALCPDEFCFLREVCNYSNAKERYQFFECIVLGEYSLQVWSLWEEQEKAPQKKLKGKKIDISYEDLPPMAPPSLSCSNQSDSFSSFTHNTSESESSEEDQLEEQEIKEITKWLKKSPLRAEGKRALREDCFWQFVVYQDGKVVDPLEDVQLEGLRKIVVSLQEEWDDGIPWIERKFFKSEFCKLMWWFLENGDCTHLCPVSRAW